jgi:HEAT repeat protein
MNTLKTKLFLVLMSAGLALPMVASAGIDGSTAKINSAISSGSVDAIVAELERAENIPTTGAVGAVLKLVDHPSDRVREAAGWWLGRRGARVQVIKMAEVRLNAEDPVAARNVLDALRGMRDVATLDLVGGYMSHVLDEESGIAALRTLGAIGSPKALSYVTPALTSSLAGVRLYSLRSVRELRAPLGKRVVTDGSAFILALKDADENVRREAAYTLGYLAQRGQNPDPATSGVNALVGVVTSDVSANVRKAAAWALGEIGSPVGRDALRAAANDADASVRSIANAASGRIN